MFSADVSGGETETSRQPDKTSRCLTVSWSSSMTFSSMTFSYVQRPGDSTKHRLQRMESNNSDQVELVKDSSIFSKKELTTEMCSFFKEDGDCLIKGTGFSGRNVIRCL